MQARVVELIPQLADEGFIEELLMVNDDLNNAFIRYERCIVAFVRGFKELLLSCQHSSVQNTCGKPAPRPQACEKTKESQRAILNLREMYSSSPTSKKQNFKYLFNRNIDMSNILTM